MTRLGDGSARSALRSTIWLVLVVAVLAYLVNNSTALGSSGSDRFFDNWLNDAVLWSSAGLCLAGARRRRRGRTAWLLVAAALASWAIGDTISSIRFGSGGAPLTSVSDVFWLAWYPLVVVALVLLIRDCIPTFELHRWIDGLVVMLLVAVPCVALFLQPAAERSGASLFADAVSFAYPLGDAIVIGAALGASALMGWRVGRMWFALGLGLAAMGIADSIYSVNALAHSYHQGSSYEAAWAGGAVLIAYAAWQQLPQRLDARPVTGWSAVALPLAAQVLAVAIQVYAVFHELPTSERVLTVAVLLIAIAQIVMTRPRAPAAENGR